MSAPVGPGIYAHPVRIVDELDNAKGLVVNDDGSINVVASGGGGGVSHVMVDNFPATQPVSIAQPSASSVTRVTSSATVVTLLTSNSARKGGYFYNDSTANVYVKLGAGASSTSKTLLMLPGSYFELPAPVYTGTVTGTWATANGAMDVTEA